MSFVDKTRKWIWETLFTNRGLSLACIGVIALESILTPLIVKYVPYTEIDWKAYMQQVKMFREGAITQYDQIEGDTGPLVYPAAHIYSYTALYHLTNAGTDIELAQYIFTGIYLLTLTLILGIYCKTEAIPPYILPLLALSKRLHSIYVLRLFNDGIGMCIFYASLLALVYRRHFLSTVLFSLAVGIKMNILLFLPAYALVYTLQSGLFGCLRLVINTLSIQLLLARPFVRTDSKAYVSRAFNLGRQFLFKWTVNWRFIREDIFLSKSFAWSLLGVHAVLLLAFALFKWLPRDGVTSLDVIKHTFKYPSRRPIARLLNAKEISQIVFTCNLIGIICARSLHYQFYSWYAHQIPFLAYTTRYPLVFKIALCVAIEYAWNVFPSTDISSSVLLASNVLLLAGQAYS